MQVQDGRRAVEALGGRVVRRAQRRGFSPGRVYSEEIASQPQRERMFLGSVGFFGGFGAARGITHAIRSEIGPFRNLQVGGRHLHHMVFGIGGLLGIGYLWLLLVGTDHRESHRASQVTSVAYGVASALTLDEFALWLNLRDVYWARQGKVSLDAAAVFGGLLSMGVWGAPFLRGMARELEKLL